MIVTIDGPAGAGKSTVARSVARRLRFRFLDTGAMYRAVALAGARQKVDWNARDVLAKVARESKIEQVGARILLDRVDVTDAIRTAAVTAVTRYAADNPLVREHLVQLQRQAARGHDLVTEGRDQGTVVFPDAECKIFLTAGAEERARRRAAEMTARGEPVDHGQILADQTRRDIEDQQRPIGRLVRAEDAVEIPTDGLTAEQVAERIVDIARQLQSHDSAG